MITRPTCDNIQLLTVSDGLSDHHTVIVDVNFFRRLVQSKHNECYRPIHKIDIDAFKADIPNLPDLTRDPKGNCPTCMDNTIMYSRLYLINTPR